MRVEIYKIILNQLPIKLDTGGGCRGNRRCPRCVNCQELKFVKINGYLWCENCGCELGSFIGNFDKRDYERTIYRKKSIYQREYHYKNKVAEANKKFSLNLDIDDQYELYKKLMAIDDKVMEKMNKKFKRKRLINVSFLIKKFLNDDDKIQIKLSEKTLEFYNEWYDYYLTILPKREGGREP